MGESGEGEKEIHVVPVVGAQREQLNFFERMKEQAEKYGFLNYLNSLSSLELFFHFRYPNLKFTSPVLYDPSPYPKSDALKVVSDAGSRLSLAPGAAALFFASPELLPHVVDTVLSVGGGRASSRSSPVAAQNRRWFVRGIAGTQVHTAG